MSSEIYVGLSGVLAARKAIVTVGQNVANATTPGYARREVSLSGRGWSVASAESAEGGVSIEQVRRIKDMFLQGRLLTYTGGLERSQTLNRYLAEIESLTQEPSDRGIGAALEDFFNQWQALAVRPEDPTARTALLLGAEHLAQQLSSLRQSLVEMRCAILQDTAAAVAQVNALAAQLAGNNQVLSQSVGPESSPLGLEDERDRILTELARLIGAVNISPGEAASVRVGGSLLVDGADHFEIAPPADYNSGLTATTGGASGPLEPTSGKIAALLELNRELIPSYIRRLDELAAGLIRAINDLHAQGIAQTGRFTELTAAYRVQDLDGDGDAANDPLARAGLPFAPQAGTLRINIVDQATGLADAQSLAVDPATQSLSDLAASLDALDNLSASVVDGRLRIAAAPGYGFDFSADQGTDLLAALGLNAFFQGRDASDIRVAERLADHPELIAAGRTTDAGDGSNAAAIAGLRYQAAGGETLPEFWRRLVTELGALSASAQNSEASIQATVNVLHDQEQSLSGVSLDEEAAKLLQYQQMYSACARYLATISRLNELLLQYL